jgi:undecaprenyl-diphosphatase
MNDLLAALLLGIIEGVTEFLPISSTGHLLIAEHWLGHRSDLFNIAIQAGAILAVVLIYRERLVQLLVGWAQRRHRDYALKLALAFAVTAVCGIIVKKLGFELPEEIAPIAWALLIGGFAILAIEAIDARRPDLPDDDPNAIGWGTAVLVGLAQVLAGVFPGTSRSAAAIFAALLFGRSSRLAATEFAFLVGIPTMFAATGYEVLELSREGGIAGEDWTALSVAFVASAITAFVSVKWLLGYIQTHRFTWFAWYRIVFGIALLVWLQVATATAPAATAAAEATASPEVAAASHAAPSPTAPAARATRAPRAAQTFHRIRTCLLAARTPPASGAHPDADCARLAPRLRDGSAHTLALAAANAGDADAAFCYATADLPMTVEQYMDPAVFSRYRIHAPRFIEQGITVGDWRMVRVGLAAYAMYPGASGDIRPRDGIVAPGVGWIMDMLPVEDPVRGYGLLLLWALGGAEPPGAAEELEQATSATRERLTPAQAREAEEWAERAFQRSFGGRARSGPVPASCLESSDG